MSREIKQALAFMVDLVTDLVFDGAGNVVGNGSGDEVINSEVGYHFGFYSRPNDGAAGVVVRPNGKGGMSFLLAFRNFQYELSLNKGDVAMANEAGAKVLLDADGNILATSKTGEKVKLQGGGNGIARLNDQVQVTIPAGSFLIAAAGPGVVGTPNPAPITVTGQITAASTTAECG